MKTLLAILAFFILASLAPAKTCYIDVAGGKDANDGLSAQRPWRTLGRAGAAAFAPGDALLLRRGQTWREQLTIPASGKSGAPLTIGAYGSGSAPTISGANRVTYWTLAQGSIWKAPCSAPPNIVAFNGAIGNRKTALYTLTAPRDWCWSGGQLYVFAPANPDQAWSSPGVEAAARSYCIYSFQRSYLNYENLNLTYGNRSCLRANGASRAINLSGVSARGAGDQAGFEFDAVAGITLNGCSVDYCRSVSVGDGFMFKGGCANVTLRNCRAAYNRRRGGQFDTGIGGFIRIQGGEFHHQYGLNQSDGLSLDQNDNILIEGVWSHDNGINNDSADGIQISGRSRNPVVRYCRLERNFNAGLILEADGGSLYDNISAHNRHGVAVGGNPNLPLHIYNNTCFNNEFGLFFYEMSPMAQVIAENNILYGSSANQRAAFLTSGLSDSNINLDYNCLWGDQDRFLIEWNGALYPRSQYSRFQAATRQNPNGFCANPLFQNAAAGDYRLHAGSPCFDRGLSVGLIRDNIGTAIPFGVRPTIGALE